MSAPHHAAMTIMIESGEALHESPHTLIVGVKNVRPVAMYFDAVNLLGIAVSADVRTPVENDYREICLC